MTKYSSFLFELSHVYAGKPSALLVVVEAPPGISREHVARQYANQTVSGGYVAIFNRMEDLTESHVDTVFVRVSPKRKFKESSNKRKVSLPINRS